jgi:hypothetical protein
MAVNYTFIDLLIGAPPLNVSGDTTQRIALGTIALGRDPTYGEGEFLYMKFTGTTVAGDFVIPDRFALTCTQSPTSATKGPVGISMAAQASGTYGWVLVRGVHDAANVATSTAANALLSGSSTAGRASTGVANYNFDVALCKTLAASNLATVELYWPVINGR